jgi:hypothetical protein
MKDRSIGRSRTEARRASHAFLILPMGKARGCSVHRLDHRPGALKGLSGPGGPCRCAGGVAAQTLVTVWHPWRGVYTRYGDTPLAFLMRGCSRPLLKPGEYGRDFTTS